MWKSFVLFFFFAYAHALNDAEGRKLFEDHVKQCAEKSSIDVADLAELKELKVPTKPEIKCVLACAYRIMGTLDKEGKYDLNKGYEFAELMKDGDEHRLENGRRIADLCVKVNDEPVTDGEKGCDRAALMFECIVLHAPRFGFKLQ